MGLITVLVNLGTREMDTSAQVIFFGLYVLYLTSMVYSFNCSSKGHGILSSFETEPAFFYRSNATKCGRNNHVCTKQSCLLLHLDATVVNGELANYDVTKSSSDNFPTFPRTVLFVKGRNRAIFNFEYLAVVLTKTCKTLDYDYLDFSLLF